MEHYLSLISIIIPIYNAERYLDKCLTSILKQSFVNYEVILIDDGSTDNSITICKKYVNADSRFLYYQIENGGPSKARNVGIENASGDFLTFIDADDWVDTDYLHNFINHIYSSNNKLIGQYCIYNREDGTQTKETNDNIILTSVWANLFEREIIMKNSLKFDETMKLGEDTLFCLEYLKYVNGIQKIDSFSYHYYLKEEAEFSLTKSVTFDSLILFVERLRKKQQEEYIRNNIYLWDFIVKHIDEQVNSAVWLLEKDAKVNKSQLLPIEFVQLIFEKKKSTIVKMTQSKAYRLGKFLLRPLSYIRHKV